MAKDTDATNRQAQAILTVLAWAARCDGPVGHRKAAAIARASARNPSMVAALADALADCESIDFEELRQALDITTQLPEAAKLALVRTTVATCLADGAPGPAAEHALRFVADAHCRVGTAETVLARAYEAHGARLRPPGDPTSFEWWERRGERRLGDRAEAGLVTARGLGELRDLATLGLGPDATPAMVQAAFRVIVRDYHPDRFHSEPEDVRAQALERFRRAREAYERLAPE
jgi:hypothetical protein